MRPSGRILFLGTQPMMYSHKKKIQQALETNDLTSVVELAREDRKVVSLLVRLAYDKSTLVGWRAITAVGLIARELARSDAEFLRETCRKLLWSLSDESGGIGWAAPELLGEIMSADPPRFIDIIPLVAQVYEAEEDTFRPGILYAFSRIAETAPELIARHQKIMILSLAERDPHARILGLKLIGQLWRPMRQSNLWSDEYQERISNAVAGMIYDKGEAWIFVSDGFTNVQTGEIAIEIFKKYINTVT